MLDALLAVSSFVASVFQVGQSQFQHGNELRWSEIDYYIQHRQIRIDIVNNAREDIQDRFNKDQQNLDSNLVVVTLMLGIGFAFVVEGTYAGMPSGQDGSVEHWLQRLYAIVVGFSVIFPFLSMLCLWECRRRLILFMKGFHETYYAPLIKKLHEEFAADSRRADAMSDHMHRKTQKLPCSAMTENDAKRALLCCRRRRNESGAPRRTSRVHHSQPALAAVLCCPTLGEVDVLSAWPEAYSSWWETWIATLDHIALTTLHLALHCNVCCCTILLGLYFEHEHHDKPEMWIAYVCVIMLGWSVALCASFHFYCTGADLTGAMESQTHLLFADEKQPLYAATLCA